MTRQGWSGPSLHFGNCQLTGDPVSVPLGLNHTLAEDLSSTSTRICDPALETERWTVIVEAIIDAFSGTAILKLSRCLLLARPAPDQQRRLVGYPLAVASISYASR
jgi:hypothetical protein